MRGGGRRAAAAGVTHIAAGVTHAAAGVTYAAACNAGGAVIEYCRVFNGDTFAVPDRT